MISRRKLCSPLLLALLLAGLYGCGQKGELYLPGQEPPTSSLSRG